MVTAPMIRSTELGLQVYLARFLKVDAQPQKLLLIQSRLNYNLLRGNHIRKGRSNAKENYSDSAAAGRPGPLPGFRLFLVWFSCWEWLFLDFFT